MPTYVKKIRYVISTLLRYRSSRKKFRPLIRCVFSCSINWQVAIRPLLGWPGGNCLGHECWIQAYWWGGTISWPCRMGGYVWSVFIFDHLQRTSFLTNSTCTAAPRRISEPQLVPFERARKVAWKGNYSGGLVLKPWVKPGLDIPARARNGFLT